MFYERNRYALKELKHYIDLGVSGELRIKVGETLICVFLQDGRIAWAHHSDKQRRLIDFIETVTKTPRVRLNEAFAICVAQKRHFAETLVSLKIASFAQVSQALLLQIRSTLETLVSAVNADVGFIPRDDYEKYDRTMTYEWDLVCGAFGFFNGNAARRPPAAEGKLSCLYKPMCSMFPLLKGHPALDVLQELYCNADFDRCERFQRISAGSMPEPELLPNGARYEKT